MSDSGLELVVGGDPEIQIKTLQAVRLVEAEYGLVGHKPCIAFLLDGNIGGAGQHEAAFVIAIECRRLKLSEKETERVLTQWAAKIGYRQRDACRAIRNAFAKKSDGSWHYWPPGISNKPGGIYRRVLGAICEAVGCPANCAPYAKLHRGPRGQGYRQFETLGWPLCLRKQHHNAAIDYYRAICELEELRGFSAGALLLTAYRQLADLAGRDFRHAGENLRVLYTRGLLSKFERGSGSGPKAHDRKPTQVSRQVPIPSPPQRYLAAITNRWPLATPHG